LVFVLDGLCFACLCFGAVVTAGVSRAHDQAIQNLVVALRQCLRGTPCTTYAADLRLHVRQLRAYFYPDVAVSCSPADSPVGDANATAFSEPRVVFEVLSDSTEAFDRGEKFEAYKQIPSLEEYGLVSVRDRRVEVFRRARGWICEESAGGPVALESLDLVLKPDEIFDQLG